MLARRIKPSGFRFENGEIVQHLRVTWIRTCPIRTLECDCFQKQRLSLRKPSKLNQGECQIIQSQGRLFSLRELQRLFDAQSPLVLCEGLGILSGFVAEKRR